MLRIRHHANPPPSCGFCPCARRSHCRCSDLLAFVRDRVTGHFSAARFFGLSLVTNVIGLVDHSLARSPALSPQEAPVCVCHHGRARPGVVGHSEALSFGLLCVLQFGPRFLCLFSLVRICSALNERRDCLFKTRNLHFFRRRWSARRVVLCWYQQCHPSCPGSAESPVVLAFGAAAVPRGRLRRP